MKGRWFNEKIFVWTRNDNNYNYIFASGIDYVYLLFAFCSDWYDPVSPYTRTTKILKLNTVFLLLRKMW